MSAVDPDLFEVIGRGEKVRCTVCGRSGYPGEAGWQEACRAGHPYLCTCGRLFSTKQGLQRHRGHEAKAARDAADTGMGWPPVSVHVNVVPVINPVAVLSKHQHDGLGKYCLCGAFVGYTPERMAEHQWAVLRAAHVFPESEAAS
jgi:hypothetical protein